jgi:hypothetical protein
MEDEQNGPCNEDSMLSGLTTCMENPGATVIKYLVRRNIKGSLRWCVMDGAVDMCQHTFSR